MKDSRDVKLSVIVFTYNHGEFVESALQGILNQKVDFEYEIIVSDDCSTDNTMQIVEKFRKNHPHIFKVLKSEKNGVFINSLRVKEYIRGEYFALLDGDDYWIYANKLKRQVDFLEENKDYNGVFHDANIIQYHEAEKILFGSKKSYSQIYNYPSVIHPSDVVKRLILPTASAVIRTSALNKVDFSTFGEYYSLDWKLYCHIIRRSKFHFINEPWAIYRNHINGISKTDNEKFYFSNIEFLKNLLKDNYYKHHHYDIYCSITNEISNLLELKNASSSIKKGKLFRSYVCYEFKKIFFFRKKIFNKVR